MEGHIFHVFVSLSLDTPWLTQEYKKSVTFRVTERICSGYYNYMQQNIYPWIFFEKTKRGIHYAHTRTAGQPMKQNTY